MQGTEDALVPSPLVLESTVVAEPLGRELLGRKLHDGFREGLKQKGRGDGLGALFPSPLVTESPIVAEPLGRDQAGSTHSTCTRPGGYGCGRAAWEGTAWERTP